MKSPVVTFILKALLIFVVWYLIYELWLLPDGRLDTWLSYNIIGNTAGILQNFGFEIFTVDRIIGIGEHPGIEIVNGCNGIAAMGLFMGFILAYPGDWKNRISFTVLGIGVIYLVNILRIITLSITQAKWPSIFDFMHDYSTTAIFYLFIFLLWMIWVNFNEANFEHKAAKEPV